MANLDTRSKRASSVNVLKPYILDLVFPDGTISQADRQHSAWDYSGIATAPAVPVAFPDNAVYVRFREKRTFARGRDGN